MVPLMTHCLLQDVYAGYGEATILKGITLRLEARTLNVIMGPNGSGKTTLLKTIAGLTRVYRGRIICGRQDVTKSPPWERGVALLLNPHPLHPSKTVLDNLRMVRNLALNRGRSPPELNEVVSRIGIEHLLEKQASRLSRGENQLVGLAQAILSESKVVLMDEPLSNLDQNYKGIVARIISDEILGSGKLIIMSSHELADVSFTEKYRIFLLKNGRLLGMVNGGYLEKPFLFQISEPFHNLNATFIYAKSPLLRKIREKCGVSSIINLQEGYIALPSNIFRPAESDEKCDIEVGEALAKFISPGQYFLMAHWKSDYITLGPFESGTTASAYAGTRLCLVIDCILLKRVVERVVEYTQH